MSYTHGDKKYHRLNIYTDNYVEAMNRNASPEELHCYLRNMLTEAIRTEITLEHLLRVLSGSSIKESNTDIFIDNVSRHYAYGITAAKAQQNEKEVKEKTDSDREQTFCQDA